MSVDLSMQTYFLQNQFLFGQKAVDFNAVGTIPCRTYYELVLDLILQVLSYPPADAISSRKLNISCQILKTCFLWFCATLYLYIIKICQKKVNLYLPARHVTQLINSKYVCLDRVTTINAPCIVQQSSVITMAYCLKIY